MESLSNLSPNDVVRELPHHLPSIVEDSTLVKSDFPSLLESYGTKKDGDANPKIGTAVRKDVEGVVKDLNPINLELVVQEKVGLNRKSDENFGSTATEIGGSTNPKSKDWRVLFPYPTPITHQPSMKFIPPADLNGNMVVDYSAVDYTEGMKRCEEYVVGFCVGKKLSFPAVREAVTKHWKLKNEVSIKLHGNGAFVFEFKDDEDRKTVLELGSFFISKSLFTVRPWSNMIESSISSIRTIPIWVLIYGVPLHMWDNEGLSLISSFLGKPILADDCTLKRERLVFARICVEVDVDFNYPESIPLMIDGKIALELPVEYHWKPPKCDSCKVFGHSNNSCTKIRKTRWTQKQQNKFTKKVSSSTSQEDCVAKAVSIEETQVPAAKISVFVDDLANVEQSSANVGVEARLAPTSVSTRSQGNKGSIHKAVENPSIGINAGKVCNMVEKNSIGNRGKQQSSVESPGKSARNGPKAAGIGIGLTSKSVGLQATENGIHKPFVLPNDYPYQWKDLLDNASQPKKDDPTNSTTAKILSEVELSAPPASESIKGVQADSTRSPKKTIQKGVEEKHNPFIVKGHGNWEKASSRKSPTKIVASDANMDDRTVKSQVDTAKSSNKIASIHKTDDTPVKVNNTFRVLSESTQNGDRVTVEECEEHSEDSYDLELDKYAPYLTCEDKASKKIEKERSRLKWNGEIPNSENLGKGQRSAARKLK